MKTASLPKVTEGVRMPDPHFAAAQERVKAAVKDLQDRGILDADGRRIRTDLPEDMREGSERDFGG